MYCFFCGRENNDNHDFCIYCGKRLHPNTEAVSSDDKRNIQNDLNIESGKNILTERGNDKRNKLAMPAIIISALIIIVLAVVFSICLKNRTTSTPNNKKDLQISSTDNNTDKQPSNDMSNTDKVDDGTYEEVDDGKTEEAEVKEINKNVNKLETLKSSGEYYEMEPEKQKELDRAAGFYKQDWFYELSPEEQKKEDGFGQEVRSNWKERLSQIPDEDPEVNVEGDFDPYYVPEPYGKEISVDRATQRKMNVFLSNFSEAFLFYYDKDQRKIGDLFQWVYIWCKINKDEYNEVEHIEDEYYYRISIDNINKIIDRYLGFRLTEEEASMCPQKHEGYHQSFYKDGYYYETAADGESYTLLTIVSKVEDLGGNKLKLYYNVYSQDIDVYLDNKDKKEYYSLTNDEAEMNPELEIGTSGYAIVRISGNSYILEHLE